MDRSPENPPRVLVAAPTPFDEGGDLDLPALQENIGRWLAAGVDGILVLGSTGEAVHLDEDESSRVLAAAREVVPRDKTLMTGAARPSTRATRAWIATATELGSDSVLVLTPHYYKPEVSRDLLSRYYRDVAATSNVDVYLYSMPAFTGVTLSVDLVAELAGLTRIRGLKDSSGDAAAIFDTVSRVSEGFEVFNGSARSVFPSLASGSAGSILAIASVAPEIAVAAHTSFMSGDFGLARFLAARLARLSSRLAPFGLGGLKAGMTLRGYRGGVPRAPLAFDHSALPVVRAALSEAELI